MRKIIPMVIIGMLVSCGLGTVIASNDTSIKSSQKNIQSTVGSSYEDEIDQSMTTPGGYLPAGWYHPGGNSMYNLTIAQSFIPQKELLTRVQFFMAKNATTTYPCILSIRDNLTGADLTRVGVDPSEFSLFDPVHPENMTWVTFDFNDIWVNPGTTYYIVISTTNVTDNYYYCEGNGSNLYPNGSVSISLNEGQTWQELPDGDGCFKTYGLRETFFEITQNHRLFGASWGIKNIGNVTAWDVEAGITIMANGIFKKMNYTFTVSADQLVPNESLLLKTGMIFGLGPIHIKIWASAVNVKEISVETDALIFLFFIFIK